jgi:hypothetical protein
LASSWKIAPVRIGAVVVLQRALDIEWVRVTPLDQIAVIAIHCPHEVGKGRAHPSGQAAPEAGAFCCEVERQIDEGTAMPGLFCEQHRAHEAHRLPAIEDRFHVRFYVDARSFMP